MDITNRTVFIAGATSGIGLELARRFAAAGSAVIAGGRRTDLLGKIAAEGFATVEIDVTDQASVDRARDTVLAAYPGLDTVMTMSGVMLVEDLRDPAHFTAAEQTVARRSPPCPSTRSATRTRSRWPTSPPRSWTCCRPTRLRTKSLCGAC
jgi:uncharacterized oxidoreductase